MGYEGERGKEVVIGFGFVIIFACISFSHALRTGLQILNP